MSTNDDPKNGPPGAAPPAPHDPPAPDQQPPAQSSWQSPPQQGWQDPQQSWQPPPQQGQWPHQPPPQQAWQQAPPQGWQQPPPGWQPPPGSPPGPSATSRASSAAKDFVNIYLRRAFRLRLHTEDLLESERQALERAPVPVTDPNVQAFLVWRRSLLFVIAVFLVPTTVLAAIDTFSNLDPNLETLNGLSILLWLVTLVFTIAVWALLKRWTDWTGQRKFLLRFWLVYFLAPFLIWLFPLRSAFGGVSQRDGLLLGALFSVFAVLTLAPKALSLMPGLIRASVVAKSLFPGSSAPGWLITLAAPIYALIAYIVLLTPYQITGNGLFVPAMIGLIGAPLWLARSGAALARPLSEDEAIALIRRTRSGYHALNAIGGLFLLLALGDLVSQLQINFWSAMNLVLALVTNVLLIGLIATDVLLVSLDRARGLSGEAAGQEHREVYESHLARFLEGAPGLHGPPPSPPGDGAPGA